MNDRKVYLGIMNKLLHAYYGGERGETEITESEYALIDAMISLGYLNKGSFAKLESGSLGIIRMEYAGGYPLTSSGKEYYDMGWYQFLKQSSTYQLIRDIAAFIGAIAGVAIGVLSLF